MDKIAQLLALAIRLQAENYVRQAERGKEGLGTGGYPDNYVDDICDEIDVIMGTTDEPEIQPQKEPDDNETEQFLDEEN